jgi:hypothetical protein
MHGTIYLGEIAQHFADLAGGLTLKVLETRRASSPATANAPNPGVHRSPGRADPERMI